MKLSEMYDQWLDEVYESEYEAAPDWMKKWNSPSEAFEDCDPIAYRCGYSDFVQPEQFEGMDCPECGEAFDEHDVHRLVNDCDEDDTLECCVCAGTRFRCTMCDETCDVDHHVPGGLCPLCVDEAMEVMEEDDDDA